MTLQDFKNNLFTLLTETFESGNNPDGTVYLDRGAGLFDTIGPLSAEQASREIFGTSIAAHTHHSLFYLEVLERFMQGNTSKADWRESWQVKQIDEADWQALKSKLKASYRRIRNFFEEQTEWDSKLEAGFDMVVHTAYHLGAIRQLVKGLS
jgi:hypothetical protein